jgi:Spy/CpxP family protein refolding chaperone
MRNYTTGIISLTAAASAMLLLAFTSSAIAGPGDGPRAGFGGPGFDFPRAGLMLEHMADHLDLDETQRQEIENILEAAKPEFQALREAAMANREALEALDPVTASYSADLAAIAAENGRLATEGTLLAVRVRGEVHAVLTDEQIAKLERGKERLRGAIEQRRGGPR